MLRGLITSATNVGLRSYQEDSFVIIRHKARTEEGWLLAVMDGHSGFEVSKFCKDNIEGIFKDLSRDAISRKTLREIIGKLDTETRLNHAGSTISLVYISETKALAHVAILGDSPVLIKNKNRVWIGPEHNIRTNLKDRDKVIKKGAIYRDGYMCNQYGSGLQLTRALGDNSFDELLIRTPKTFTLKIHKGSFVIVASDGLLDPSHGSRDINNLIKIVEEKGDAQSLVNDALERRTRDNVTAILWRQAD